MFDEEPDGDPHGECAAEIYRLASEHGYCVEVLRELLIRAPAPRLMLDDYGIALDKARIAVERADLFFMHKHTAQAGKEQSC